MRLRLATSMAAAIVAVAHGGSCEERRCWTPATPCLDGAGGCAARQQDGHCPRQTTLCTVAVLGTPVESATSNATANATRAVAIMAPSTRDTSGSKTYAQGAEHSSSGFNAGSETYALVGIIVGLLVVLCVALLNIYVQRKRRTNLLLDSNKFIPLPRPSHYDQPRRTFLLTTMTSRSLCPVLEDERSSSESEDWTTNTMQFQFSPSTLPLPIVLLTSESLSDLPVLQCDEYSLTI
ncbi:hypothetical protein SDRG_11806 [Saprolegnia diclina VS20]|uniref:Uncharacterized protein n=1 Tax=Saprolegnia diclina (strain VS20) TaxID=1156394 RepID=T0QAH3_SAPDV|nr:hypothetical protein SDRG_11806 [Saprolegnia diclina VS20]EQC30490.1 hypothetical protein SDRG_11806 [Saprolegnia diclina VS20]|eukprot:XP_008616083.1 hypothetical protein SDRG_11806 [Saprolegnia diclina VS20]